MLVIIRFVTYITTNPFFSMIDRVSLVDHLRLCDRLIRAEARLARALEELSKTKNELSVAESKLEENRNTMVNMMNHIIELEALDCESHGSGGSCEEVLATEVQRLSLDDRAEIVPE